MASRLGMGGRSDPRPPIPSREGRPAEGAPDAVEGAPVAAEGPDHSEPASPSTLRPGTLYIVATPIGNREDITLRALRVLREADVVAAEDTRHTRALLSYHGIARPLASYREQNRTTSAPALLQRLETGTVALVSDAGMPAIADPGAELIRQVVAAGGRVEVVPGPNAALAALVGSGLPPAPFLFAGFLSRQRGDRRRQLDALAARPETLVFYEAPHRVIETLGDLVEALGDRSAAACRELTKLHEEVRRAPLSGLLDHYRTTTPRGEFVLVVHGATGEQARTHMPGGAPTTVSDGDVDALLAGAMAHGERMRAVVADLAARSNLSRREVYARWQALRRARGGPDADD